MSDPAFAAAQAIDALRLTPSEFGYRAQALLAQAIARMGGGVEDVARVGHPDILATIGGKTLRIQSKATAQSTFSLTWADLEGIRPRSRNEEGYLAVLDRGPPLQWTCVPYSKAQSLLEKAVPLAMLKSMEDPQFSAQCTSAFVALVTEHLDALEAFTFSLVRKRTLMRGP